MFVTDSVLFVLTKPMKIEDKFIEHFCLARQDESIGVKIVALSPNALMYGTPL